MTWYKCLGYQGHYGAGREEEVVVFVRADNMVRALKRYNQVPTIKKLRRGNKIPSINEAQDKEITLLEEIRRKKDIWFYIMR